MKVFITGGTGYIGQATITALRAHGHDVVALARSHPAAQRLELLGAEAVAGDLADTDTLRNTAEHADAAIHLAQDYTTSAAAADLGAATAIQHGLGSRPYVHTGGAWVYGNTIGVVDETAPQSPPPITSWRPDNEKRVLARAADGGHPVLVIPGTVYGHGGGLITAFLANPARTAAAHYIGAGDNYWTVVHVDDLAELYVAALSAPAGARLHRRRRHPITNHAPNRRGSQHRRQPARYGNLSNPRTGPPGIRTLCRCLRPESTADRGPRQTRIELDTAAP
jgi:nucleoside-diphosphate-sugar epimerase